MTSRVLRFWDKGGERLITTKNDPVVLGDEKKNETAQFESLGKFKFIFQSAVRL